jgi:hypothetical protein
MISQITVARFAVVIGFETVDPEALSLPLRGPKGGSQRASRHI